MVLAVKTKTRDYYDSALDDILLNVDKPEITRCIEILKLVYHNNINKPVNIFLKDKNIIFTWTNNNRKLQILLHDSPKEITYVLTDTDFLITVYDEANETGIIKYNKEEKTKCLVLWFLLGILYKDIYNHNYRYNKISKEKIIS